MAKKITTYLILITTSILWGTSFVFTERAFSSNEYLSPFLLVTLRLVVSIIFFLSIFVFTRLRVEKIEKKDYKIFLLLALFEPFFYFIGENYGVMYCSASISSVIIATIPVFVPIAVFFVHKETLQWYNIFGICCSLIGVAVMTVTPDMDFAAKGIGIAFLSFAVLSAVIYSVMLHKVVKKYKPITITFYQNLLAFIYFIPIIFIFDFSNIQKIELSLQTVIYIVILGIFCSSIAFLLYNYSVKKIGVSKACIFNNLIPVFTILTVVIFGTEKITTVKLAGMLIVIFGVLVTQLSINKNKISIKTNE